MSMPGMLCCPAGAVFWGCWAHATLTSRLKATKTTDRLRIDLHLVYSF
jgi:hypothetical protein